MIRRGRIGAGTLLLLAILVGMASTAAVAYWTTQGQGTGSVTTATLAPPTAPVPTFNTGFGSVTLAWTQPAGLVPDGYHVVRTDQANGATSAACGSSPAALVPGPCVDSAVPAGSYRYAVTAVLRSWTATSASSEPVTVTLDTAPPVVAVTRVNGLTPTFPYVTSSTVTSIGGTCGTAPGDLAVVRPLLDGAATTPEAVPCGSGSWTLTLAAPLTGDGLRSLSATQADVAGNLGTAPAQALTIDTTAPTVVSVARAGAAVRNAGPLDWTVTFSEPVSGVTGGSFALARGTGIGGTIPTLAAITPASGPSATWTVRASTTGTTGAGDTTSTIRLDLTSGAGIVDAAGNGLGDALPLQGQAVTYDTVAPALVAIVRTGPALVNAGPLAWTVTFTEPVTGVDSADFALSSLGVSGTPALSGTSADGGPPSSTWTVTASVSGVTAAAGSIRLDLTAAASIADVATNALPSTPTNGPDYGYDTVAPVVPGPPGVTSTAPDASYRAGQVIPVVVPFSETVVVAGSPTLTLVTGPSAVTAVPLSTGSGTSALTFAYTVLAGDSSADLRYEGPGSLTDGSITDLAGNAATRTLPTPGALHSLDANQQLVVDTTAPIVAITTANGSATFPYHTNGNITALAGSCGTQPGDLSPITLQVSNGSTTTTSTPACSNGSWSANPNLTTAGTYTVTATQPDRAGNVGAAPSRTLVIDRVAPRVIGVSSTLANGSYRAGQLVPVTVTFSEPVTVTRTPTLALRTTASGSTTTSYSEGSGTDTLTFAYTVAAGHTSSDLDYVGTTSLAVPGGAAIRDLAGNAANRTLASPGTAGSLAATKDLVIDTTAPRVSATGVSSPADNRGYGPDEAIPITITFTEPVTVTGTPKLALSTGTPSSTPVPYTSGSGSDILTFTYTVVAGNATPDLDYAGAAALTLDGGTITDAAQNPAVLTLANPGSAGSLAANKDLLIDAVPPEVTVTSITRQTLLFWRQVRASGTAEYGAGPLTVHLCSTAPCGPDNATRTSTNVPVGTDGVWTSPWSGWAAPGTWYASATQADALGNVGTSATFGPYSS
jgi:hypothetical protein